MMSIFSSFLDVFRLNSELAHSYDFDLIQNRTKRVYLKTLAIENVANFIGRSISETEFRVYKDNELDRGDIYYRLNVKPNLEMNAAEFWQKVIHKLLTKNEVLIIISDTNDLLIADSYYREEKALYAGTFRNVVVKDYDFKRTFSMDQVIFLEHNNGKLEEIVSGMLKDLEDVYGRKLETLCLENQIRATVGIETTGRFDKDKAAEMQEYINKIYETFSKNTVAIVPQQRGFTYTEVSTNTRGSSAKQTSNELTKLSNEFTDTIAKTLGVPPDLIHGDSADQESNIKMYLKFCIGPLLNKIETELNCKMFSKKDFLKGAKILTNGINTPDIFELSTAIDKLVSSGAYNRNEIRQVTGYDPTSDGDVFLITKNYQTADDTMKGVNNNDEN